MNRCSSPPSFSCGAVFRMKELPFALLALVALALTPAVDAQEDWAYYGLSIGEFDYSQEVILGQEPFADSVNSWHLMIGYQFMKHLAVEGGYGKTSTVRDTATFSSPLAPGSVELGLETELSKILTFRPLVRAVRQRPLADGRPGLRRFRAGIRV